MVDKLMARLRTHPELGKRLFLYEAASDLEITHLYAHAAGLLFLSKGEGFGLPLVEAAHHGIAIICSDLPVFREIAGDYATYISATNPQETATEILDWWHHLQEGRLPDTVGMPRLTWEQSADALLNVIIDNNWLRTEQ